jgi:hypothetical protein
MGDLIQDVRYAIRNFRDQRRFTLTIVLTLAVGIGAAAALFTVVNAILLRPLRYKEADQLVRVYESNMQKDTAFFSISPPN